MDPNYTNPETSGELPQPEQVAGEYTAEQSVQTPEIQRTPPTPHPQLPTTSPLAANPIAPSVPAAAMPPISTSQLTQQLIADDADLIEKEWVLKAKAIVMHTKDDPHKQNQEMNKVKADYLKKRYNKDLKINEG